MALLFLIEDDPTLSGMLREALEKEGHRVLCAYSGTEAKLLLEMTRPELVLLDLTLPGIPGESLLGAFSGVPVIVVSAKTDVPGKAKLLREGAADYVTKPFALEELSARIEAQLRAARQSGAGAVRFHELTLPPEGKSVEVLGETVRLTRTEFAILKALLQNPGQVLTKNQLLERIAFDTPDCTESSLKIHVSHLRKKLREKCGRDCVESVWGIGFRLRAPEE